MKTKNLVTTLLLAFAVFMAVPAFAIDNPGVTVDPSFGSAPASEELLAPSGTPAAGNAEKAMIPGYDVKDRLPITSIYRLEHR